MLSFDKEKFTALVWDWASQQGTISFETWEQIICESCGGSWIGGDKYMTDGHKDNYGLNDKTVKKEFTKGETQTLSFIQCRIPITDEADMNPGEIGEEVIKTLVEKRQNSFNDFNLDTMLDVVVVHHRIGDNYYARLFCYEQPKYEEMDLVWTKTGKNHTAKLIGSKERDPWVMQRNSGGSSAYQTCLQIKKVFKKSECIFDIEVNAPYITKVSAEESILRYKQMMEEKDS